LCYSITPPLQLFSYSITLRFHYSSFLIRNSQSVIPPGRRPYDPSRPEAATINAPILPFFNPQSAIRNHQCSITPSLQYSTTPAFCYPTTPSLHYSNTPAFQSAIRNPQSAIINAPPLHYPSFFPIFQVFCYTTTPSLQYSSYLIRNPQSSMLHHSNTPPLRLFVNPSLNHSTTPILQLSNPQSAIRNPQSSMLHHSTTPILQLLCYSITPPLQLFSYSITLRFHYSSFLIRNSQSVIPPGRRPYDPSGPEAATINAPILPFFNPQSAIRNHQCSNTPAFQSAIRNLQSAIINAPILQLSNPQSAICNTQSSILQYSIFLTTRTCRRGRPVGNSCRSCPCRPGFRRR